MNSILIFFNHTIMNRLPFDQSAADAASTQAADAVHCPIKSWNDVEHLKDRELRIHRKNGTVQDFWRLDLEHKDLVPLRDYRGHITDYGVWLWAYMNSEYPHRLKLRSISELLELND